MPIEPFAAVATFCTVVTVFALIACAILLTNEA